MQKAQSWRTLLAIIIRDPRIKQRILDELGIKAITLQRWIAGDTDPRPQNLRLLVQALPTKHRDSILQLLSQEKGHVELISSFQDESPVNIPTELYTQVLEMRAYTAETQRFWALSELITEHALKQLDPEGQQGVCIWIAQCMPPSGSFAKVRSIREVVGRGTLPWATKLDQEAIFLGAESLTGSVITSCRPTVVQDIEDVKNILPIQQIEHEQSIAIYPMLYAGRVGGALLAGSAQRNYFTSPARTTLIQRYADLATLALETTEFYPSDTIALNIMPNVEEQKQYFKLYPGLLSKAIEEDPTITNLNVETRAWQKLEEILLNTQDQQRRQDKS